MKLSKQTFFPLLKENAEIGHHDSATFCTVPWLLIKSFEKSDFASKWLENVQNVQKMGILQIFPWDFPMGVLKIEVHPMGQWMAFLISGCCPDSNAVEILKIGWVCNSLPYLHMGLRDLSFTPLYMWITSHTTISIKSH